MKKENPPTSKEKTSKVTASLFSLACAAACVPTQAEAAIIVGNINTTVGLGPSHSSLFQITLPDSIVLSLKATANAFANQVSATFLSLDPAYGIGNFFAMQSGGRTFVPATNAVQGGDVAFRTGANSAINWGNAPGIVPSNFNAIIIGSGNIYSSAISASVWKLKGPGSFNTTKYLLFKFGSLTTPLYGWVEMTQATRSFQDPSAMSVTFGRWAYDDSGAFIGAGSVVPEPSSAALLMGGALILGAAGLRRWRQQKQQKNCLAEESAS